MSDSCHQNDRIFISHRHQLEDGFLHLEELDTHAEEHNSGHAFGRSPSARREQVLSSRRIHSSVCNYYAQPTNLSTILDT